MRSGCRSHPLAPGDRGSAGGTRGFGRGDRARNIAAKRMSGAYASRMESLVSVSLAAPPLSSRRAPFPADARVPVPFWRQCPRSRRRQATTQLYGNEIGYPRYRLGTAAVSSTWRRAHLFTQRLETEDGAGAGSVDARLSRRNRSWLLGAVLLVCASRWAHTCLVLVNTGARRPSVGAAAMRGSNGDE
jgi:hypothetical protein